ncbi:hypothetical protein ACHAXT_012553 [Thalassiosira profunda]
MARVEAELRALLDERDRYLDDLENELAALEAENERLQDAAIVDQSKLSECQTTLKTLRSDNDELIGENARLEDEVTAQKSRLDAQKRVLAAAANTSDEQKRVQRDSNKQLHRLELENERLRAAVLEIEDNEDVLVNEIDLLVTEKTKFQEQSEQLASTCDTLYRDADEKARSNSLLLQEKERAVNDLEAEQQAHAKDLEDWKRRDAASSAEIVRLLAALDKHKEAPFVKENEAFRAELAKVRREKGKLQSAYDICLRDKNQAERDLDSAIRALNVSKRRAKEQSVSAARKEQMAVERTNTKLDNTSAKLDGAVKRCLDAEQQLEVVREQLERAEARNAAYEQNHGLTEVVRYQKRLEADVRRRDYDLKRLTKALGIELEKYRALAKACDWLKEKANVGPDFAFDDQEVKAALERDDNRLQSANAELTRQLDALESERIKLLSQLRERAACIGEKGVRFLGLSANQVAQVMEFASNVKQGTVELPLDDRSKQLTSEIATLKSDKEVDRVTIERLEREIFSLSEASNEPPHGEAFILGQAHHALVIENQKLREEVRALKADSREGSDASMLAPDLRDKVQELLGSVAAPSSAEQALALVLEQCEKATREVASPNEGVTEEASSQHAGADQRNKELTATVATLEKSLRDLRNERDVLSARLSQQSGGENGRESAASEAARLTVKCQSLEVELKAEKEGRRKALQDLAEVRLPVRSESQQVPAADKPEVTSMADSLRLAQSQLSGYMDDVAKLRSTIYAMQQSRVDSAKVAVQISCLNDLLEAKNRALEDGRKKLATAKQMNLKLARAKGPREHKSDRTISTDSIDRSLMRAAGASITGQVPARNSLQQHLQDATALVFEKERQIEELKGKLAGAETEAENMKADIATLASRLAEAEASVGAIGAYQQQCDETQNVLDSSKKALSSLKGKLSTLANERAAKDSKIKELKENLTRANRVLSVQRQGRARSEGNLKASNEEVARLKEELKKAEEQVNALKREKVDAQNAKLVANRRARMSATKLKDLTEECHKTNNAKTLDDLKQRVAVLDKTVAGLASTNSKLRGELATLRAKSKEIEEDTTPPRHLARPASHRGSLSRPMSARSKSLETQVKALQQSLAKEKKHASDGTSMLERYQKRIQALEKALQQTGSAGQGTDDEVELLRRQLKSISSENKTLKSRGNEVEMKKLQAENDNLRKENERLSKIDHLNFFEEIEDLKYKYNDAVRQINQLTGCK